MQHIQIRNHLFIIKVLLLGSDLVKQLTYKYGDFSVLSQSFTNLLPVARDQEDDSQQELHHQQSAFSDDVTGVGGATDFFEKRQYEQYYHSYVIPSIINRSKALMMPVSV